MLLLPSAALVFSLPSAASESCGDLAATVVCRLKREGSSKFKFPTVIYTMQEEFANVDKLSQFVFDASFVP